MNLYLIVLLALAEVALLVLAVGARLSTHNRDSQITDAFLGEPEPNLSKLRRTLNTRFRRTRPGRFFDRKTTGANLDLGPADLVLVLLGACALLAALLVPLLGFAATAIALVLFCFGANRWLEARRQMRADRFLAQLPDVARVIGNAAQAGLALRSGIELAARELDDPAREELQEVSQRMALGASLESALGDLLERLPSRELSVLVKTVVIQSRSGGALVTALSNISHTLMHRRELQREVKTAMTGSVFSSYLVVVLAVGCLVVVNIMSPGALDQVLANPIGQVAIALAVALFVLGQILIQRIVRIKI
ncbi:MAG: type II secretion system F family protein [Propionibacteriaceae bacterium]|jgi:tight adherence protein B|nr:type II secretion system F family protein [Propionibacteriaceae bacterium]